MLNSEEYINAATFRDQIGVMCNYLRNDKVRVSFQRIGDLFDNQKASIRQQLTKYKRGPVGLGRTPELSKVQRFIISQEIHKFHEKKHFPTYDEISDLIYLKFNKHINQDTLRNYLQEDLKKALTIIITILTPSFLVFLISSCSILTNAETKIGQMPEKLESLYLRTTTKRQLHLQFQDRENCQ